MSNRYNVEVEYATKIYVEVEAENRTEAEEKALEKMDDRDDDVDVYEDEFPEVTDIELLEGTETPEDRAALVEKLDKEIAALMEKRNRLYFHLG